MVTLTIGLDVAKEFARACVSSGNYRENQRDKSAEADAVGLDALACLLQKAIEQAERNTTKG